MSHRTKDLPPLTGLAAGIRELRYHEVSRQMLAVVLILIYAMTARPIPVIAYVGLPLAFVGMLIRLHASGFVLKNRALATTGPYALVRHPLYTGNILLIIGFAAAGSLWWGIPLALAFFWFYYPAAIEYEDRKLHRLFGATWERWAEETPALIPKLANVSEVFDGNWSFRKSTMQNGEIFIAAYILLCMALVAWRIT